MVRFGMEKSSLILLSVVLSLIIILPDISFAAPVLFDPIPKTDTHVGGGDRLFQISINESDLNTSSVTVYIISEDAKTKGEDWDSYAMLCGAAVKSDWLCNKSLSFAIVGSDTVELFYFAAKDNSGGTGSLGDEDNPLDFTLDRNPPEIDFAAPLDNSNVSSTTEIKLTVVDTSSGVNGSTVMYSDDNATWYGTVPGQPTYYLANWSTESFADNESLMLHARATDNVGNIGYTNINVLVDNEAPKIIVTQPPLGGKLGGIIFLEIDIEELYSGIDEDYVFYTVGSTQRSMDCSGSLGSYTCDEYFDTTTVPDGYHTINFTARDYAGNENKTSIEINVDNTVPFITITSPKNGAYFPPKIYVNATVSNVDVNVTGANVSISGQNYTLSEKMTCSPQYPSSYICYIYWDASTLAEVQYTFRADVVNKENKTIFNSLYATLDRTPPMLAIDMPPQTQVNGTIYPKVVVTDENGVNPVITFKLYMYNQTMNCNMQLSGKRYVCTNSFNTTDLIDGYYTLYFYAKDSAGNPNSASKVLLINNTGASNETMGDYTVPDGGTGTTTTTTTTTTQITTTTTAVAPSNVSNPIIILIGGVRDSLKPVAIVLGDVQKAIQNSLKPWPVKVLVIVLITLSIFFVLFKTGKLKRFFGEKREGAAVEEEEEEVKEERMVRVPKEAKEETKYPGEEYRGQVNTQTWVKSLNQLKKVFGHGGEEKKSEDAKEEQDENE